MNDTASPLLSLVRRLLLPVVIVALLFGFPYLLQPIAKALLVLFAGLLLAVFLDGLCRMLRSVLPVPHLVALAFILALLVILSAVFFYLAGSKIAEQMSQLAESLPQAVEKVQSQLDKIPWIREIMPSGDGSDMLSGEMLGRITTFFSSLLTVFAYTVVVLFLGIYIAFNPRLYTVSLMSMIPPRHRDRGWEVLEKLGQVMRWWLVGRISSMTVVGVLTAIGLLIIGEPLALILGVIAGLLSFIPFLGPVLSAVPAILVGLARSPTMALWVAGVYVVVQMLESNLITPIIQRKAVMLPPAFLIAAQFLAGILLGFMGILLATPLTVFFTVLVQVLYVEQVLGDDVKVLGEH